MISKVKSVFNLLLVCLSIVEFSLERTSIIKVNIQLPKGCRGSRKQVGKKFIADL